MLRSKRAGILWGGFALGLVLALWGWLWVVQRLLTSEAEAGAARVMAAEERYLREVAPGVLEGILSEIDAVIGEAGADAEPEALIPALVRLRTVSGVWFTQMEATTTAPDRVVEDWRKRVRTGSVTPEEFAAALETGELNWGWVVDGRDVVAGLALSLMGKHPGDELLLGCLRERVWDYRGAPLRPAFRLVMIRALSGAEDPQLERLRVAEELRVAWGNDGNVDSVGDYDIVRSAGRGVPLRFFWTKDQLEVIANAGRGDGLLLREKEEIGAAGIRLAILERWPVLGLRDRGQVAMNSTGVNEQALIWVGATSGLLVLALAVGTALVARSEFRLARMRTDLAASVAHELRTPLAGQRLLLESLVERTVMPESERDDYVRMAHRENLRLGRLAEEFLTFSRLERGVVVLESEGVVLGQVVREAVESLREKWEEPDCRLTVDVPPDLPAVRGDEQALVTVVRNLLENAWKYSDEEKVITITAGEQDGDAWLAVRDNGIGLDPKDQERIFKQFYRVDQRLAREREGLGIGLSIVHRLVRAMHGRVTVESEVGAGSEFKVWVPTGS